ncbi:MAG: site-specific integrase [Oscillospiraceae bacterium]|nr:site-specific integrase [Oscillospiraceae bacterium]
MPSVSKRGDTFRIMVSLGYGVDGRQIRKTTTFTPPSDVTSGKAEKLAIAFAHEYEKHCQGITNLHENMRLIQLVDWYFEEIAPHKLKESTLYGKRNLINAYIIPHIGHMKLKDINTARLDRLWNTLHKSGRMLKSYHLIDKSAIPMGSCKPTADKAGVSDETVYAAVHGKAISQKSAEKIATALGRPLKAIFTTVEGKSTGLDAVSVTDIRRSLSAIFAVAVKKEIIVKNPVTNSTPPKIEDKKKLFLDDAQCKQLLAILEQHENKQLRGMLTTLMYTGMRAGELLALVWEDVDFDTGVITVSHTLTHINGVYKRTSPKTKSSDRAVKVPDEILDLLRKHRTWQEQRKQELGSKWIERGTVFTGECGEYHNRTYLNTLFKKLLRQHDLPDVHIHDLRHANASLLINAGLPVKLISEHLGHKSTATTEEIYAHMFASSKAKTSEAISAALSGI